MMNSERIIDQPAYNYVSHDTMSKEFKESKSTAIHASRLLNEVQGRRKRKFNLLVDLQKAYDSVDRTILWRLLKRRCQNQ